MTENSAKQTGVHRKRWLETLLDRMTAPGDVMRQHLQHASQSHALGSAAEAGVRDLLRAVLPRRLAVTTGFLRQSQQGKTLADTTSGDAISPQTDVIIYDGLDATPLHSTEAADVVAALDALGVIEVKDSEHGSEELASATGEGGALDHMARVGNFAPYAFRGIVLFRGKDPPTKNEVSLAEGRLRAAKLQSYQVPPVIFCASFKADDKTESSYLAFYDFLSKRIRIHEYHGDRTPALAGFLRIVTGFFAARGRISPSLHLDLLPVMSTQPETTVPVADAEPPFESLYQRLLDRHRSNNPDGAQVPFYRLFKELLRDELYVARQQRALDSVQSHVVAGRDAANLPTAGVVILISLGRTESDKRQAAAFFYLSERGLFTCSDATANPHESWTIERESVDDYLRRAFRDSGRDPEYEQHGLGETNQAIAEQSPTDRSASRTEADQ